MSNTKFTPGPWRRTFVNHECVIVSDTNLIVADIRLAGNDNKENVQLANAQLIAKAWLIPELVKTCVALINELKPLAVGIWSTEAEIEHALTVIKKATE